MESGMQTLQGAERVSGLCSPVSPFMLLGLHYMILESPQSFCSGGILSYDKWGLPWVN